MNAIPGRFPVFQIKIMNKMDYRWGCHSEIQCRLLVVTVTRHNRNFIIFSLLIRIEFRK